MTGDGGGGPDLRGAWTFAPSAPGSRRPPAAGWNRARVPGNVHLDLMAAGLLKDPLRGRHEAAAAWVEDRDWWYRCRFRASPGVLAAGRALLEAGGLDTWCTLWLNGHRLARTETMFVEHAFEVRRLLRPGANELLLRFESPRTALKALERRQGPCAAVGDPRRAHGRKAAYSFGWDWGPRLATCGVFRPITLRPLEPVRVSDLWVRTLGARASLAEGEIHVTVESDRARQARLEVRLGAWAFRVRRRLAPGSNRLRLEWGLKRPPLWWPRGWGEPALVRADAALEGAAPLGFEVGLRTVDLRRRPDASGQSFGFAVNGRPVFAKGANWIPVDPFLGRPAAGRVARLVGLGVEARYTMLRVWGGGLFESEEFYRACDRLGLLVWQDFPFACSQAPEHPDFLALVAAEAGVALRRLRRHPSLALLCGNNESHQAHHDGWFPGPRPAAWGRGIYHGLLPRLCARLAPGVPYWPGSPYGGADPNAQGRGDRHQWEVWGRRREPEAYLGDRGRFLSEFGLASLPNRGQVARILDGARASIAAPELALHDKAGDGGALGRLAAYIVRDLPCAPGLDALRYLSQVFQSRGLALGIEHWRRLKPHTRGTLVWQHNDCWPVISWSLLDGADTPKLAYYGVRRAYDDVLLSWARPAAPGGRCEAWLSLDGPRALRGRLRVERWNMRGREAVLADLPFAARADQSRRLWAGSPRDCGVADAARQFLVAHLDLPGRRSARRAILLLARPVDLDLGPHRVRVRARGPGLEVSARSPNLALCVELRAPAPGFFEDNGFDLLPGETRTVGFKPRGSRPALGLWGAKSLNQVAEQSRRMGR